MTDDLDRLLRSSADRWRASLPPLPDLDAARARRARSRRWYVAGVAAAVLLVAGGISAGMAVLGHGDQRSLPPSAPSAPSAPTGSTGSASAHGTTAAPVGVVPWRPLAATRPSLPSTTTPASPDPAAAAGVRRCTGSDLKAADNGISGAAGTAYEGVRLDLIGPSPCRIEGVPTVRPLSRGRILEVPVKAETDMGNPFGPIQSVVVTSTAPASFEIARGEVSCPAVDNDQLEVTLPGITSSFDLPGFGRSACGPDDAGSAPISVGAIQPLHQKRARVTSPYSGVRATSDLPRSAEAGRPLDFTVTLTSKRDLPLDPCPDYTIITDAGAHRYALNCAAVPHRDAQGRPYLPAGVPVTFAAHLGTGIASDTKLVWQLITPVGYVGVGEVLTVTPPK